MKYFAILLVSVLCGCSTLRSARNAVFGDPTIDGKDKVEYAKIIEEKEAAFRQYKETNKTFMPYHYAAIGMIFCGIGMIVMNRTSNEAGVGTIMGGIGLSAWAMVAPNNIVLITILMSGGLVLSGVYVVYSLMKKA